MCPSRVFGPYSVWILPYPIVQKTITHFGAGLCKNSVEGMLYKESLCLCLDCVMLLYVNFHEASNANIFFHAAWFYFTQFYFTHKNPYRARDACLIVCYDKTKPKNLTLFGLMNSPEHKSEYVLYCLQNSIRLRLILSDETASFPSTEKKNIKAEQ